MTIARIAAARALRLTVLAVALLAAAETRAQDAAQPSAVQTPASPRAPAPPPAAPPPPQAGAYPPVPPPYVTPPAVGGYAPGYTPQPGVSAPQAGWQRPVRPSRALMITGISILGGSYLLATMVGASLMDEDDYEDDESWDECRYCNDVAPYLFIPVVGPFVAMSQTPHDAGLVLLGMVELVGAALTVGGIVRYVNTKREAERRSFGSFELKGNRELVLDVSSSMRMAGPRMTLRF